MKTSDEELARWTAQARTRYGAEAARFGLAIVEADAQTIMLCRQGQTRPRYIVSKTSLKLIRNRSLIWAEAKAKLDTPRRVSA